MATPVTLPALGESVTEGTVTRWLKQVGDSIEVDEPLLEVSTDKVDTEIPSPVAGTVLEIKVAEDETVEVGAELAVVGDRSETTGDGGGSGGEAPAQPEPTAESTQQSQPTEEPTTEEPTTEAPEPEAPATDTAAQEAQPSAAGGTAVTLPALGESVTEGTVTRWLKQVGDSIEVDEPLLEVSTDKVDTEIPSPSPAPSWRSRSPRTRPSRSAPSSPWSATAQKPPATVAAPVVRPRSRTRLSNPSPSRTSLPRPHPPNHSRRGRRRSGSKRSRRWNAPATAARPEGAAPSSGDRGEDGLAASYVTPLVRKLAAQHDVDLSGLTGTGVGGRIRKQDVLAAAESQRPQEATQEAPSTPPSPVASDVSPLRGTTEKMSRLRKTIAARMVESLQVSAQLTTVVEVDVTGIARLRDRVKSQFEQREGVKLSFLPFFAKASVDALKTFHMVNASVDTEAGSVTYHGAEHLGLAVDTERGLLVPVIKDAGDLNIAGLARKIADLAARTRESKISPDELSGGTFTLTNTGSRGALFDTPIINQPQVAILGTGSVVKRAVVIDDQNLGETIAVRRMVYLALTYDHRIVDGADAARFLSAVKERLEEADFEAELGL